ncbi:MAG: phage holin family protein [Clostridia bacterium]|nr:phage holin family protein [Clostridia bacterium]
MKVHKETILHTVTATALGTFVAYLSNLAVPTVVLIVVMLVDYGTGMLNAWLKNELNSRIGILGIVKKISYFALIVVGMVVDYILNSAFVKINIDFNVENCIGIIVVVWLIINEIISILENLSDIGIPLPKFLQHIVTHLKDNIDDTTE